MKKEDFELLKLKVDGDKIIIDWKSKIQTEDNSYADKHNVESPRKPHPDLEESLEALTQCFAKSNDLLIHRNMDILSPNQRKELEPKELQHILSAWDKKVFDSVQVTGVSLGGDLETGWCVITGKHAVHNTKMAMNSPKINFNSTALGLEAEVSNLLERLIDECYQYVYEGKGAQVVMDFASKENVAEEVEEPVNV